MRILFHIPYTDAVDAGRFIYEGWRDAFLDLGHEFFPLTAADDKVEKVKQIQPDIFMTAVNFLSLGEKKELYTQMKALGIKIFLFVDWPFGADHVDWFKKEDIVDVFFGEREPESMEGFEAQTGRKFHQVTNAANRKLHFPTHPNKKYEYDVVYLGAYLPMKERLFKEVLYPLRKKYKIKIFGPGWTTKDFILRALQRAARTVRLHRAVKFFNDLRISVPINEENVLYSSAKIALNFHEQDPEGGYTHHILNQRTFKVPACGGFEICDNVPALRRYFTEDEMVQAKTKEDWGRLIEYYLSHDEERKAMQEKATARALKDHTYHNRVKELLALYHK